MRKTALFVLVFITAVLLGCAHNSNCECGSTTPVEEMVQSEPQQRAEVVEVAAENSSEVETECATAEVGISVETTETSVTPAEVLEDDLTPAEEAALVYPEPAVETVATAEVEEIPEATAEIEETPVILIDDSLVLVSGDYVTIQDDQFTQIVFSCSNSEYTQVTINIVSRRVFVAPSLRQAGCLDFYFLTASGARSQTLRWPM